MRNLDKHRKWYKKYYAENCERLKKEQRIFYAKNKERIKEQKRIFYRNNVEAQRERCKKYRENNKEKIVKNKLINAINIKASYKKYNLKRLLNITNKLNIRFSTLVWKTLKINKNYKNWETLVGYNIKELIAHLEKLFTQNMSWDNYGRNGWEIDHIKPVSSFNFKSYDDPEFKKCWNLNNLQPLWASENRSKRNY